MAKEAPRTLRCTSQFERRLRGQGFAAIAGVDEAGRGALFGPVFAAAVILDPARPLRGLNDSKQLEPERREVLAGRIRERAAAWAVASVDAAGIDRHNIYQASRLAMRLAIAKLAISPDHLLVDAMTLAAGPPELALIHGDALSVSIAAASILAKVDRDAAMRDLDGVYPGYGLAQHKGYGTPEHLRALADLGPTEQHRFSFEPVRLNARGQFPERWGYPIQYELFGGTEDWISV